MDAKKVLIQETAIITLGQLICCSALTGVFALIGKLDKSVVWGIICGGLLAVLNFMLMALGVLMAADKAAAQDVKRGKSIVSISQIGRMIALFAIIFALVKSGFCNVFAVVIPLAFTRPILTVAEFFRKSGEPKV